MGVCPRISYDVWQELMSSDTENVEKSDGSVLDCFVCRYQQAQNLLYLVLKNLFIKTVFTEWVEAEMQWADSKKKKEALSARKQLDCRLDLNLK